MYCPKCSQQQLSDEVRFCSKCGFGLEGVKLLLADQSGQTAASTQKRDLILGSSVMMIAALVIMVLVVSNAAPTPLAAALIPLLILWALFVLGVLLSRHAVREVKGLFSKDSSAVEKTEITAAGVRGELNHGHPLGQSFWATTSSDLEPVSSVTEPTTRHLKEK